MAYTTQEYAKIAHEANQTGKILADDGGELVLRETEKLIPSLKQAKEIALTALKSRRTSFEYGGFMLDEQRWDSEPKDELRLNSTLKAFDITGTPPIADWKIADGQYVTMTPELAARAGLALMHHYNAAFHTERKKLAELAALIENGEKSIAKSKTDDAKTKAEQKAVADVLAWQNGAMLEGWGL